MSSRRRGESDRLALLVAALVPATADLAESYNLQIALWQLASIYGSDAMRDHGLDELVDSVVLEANEWLEANWPSPALMVLAIELKAVHRGAPRPSWLSDDQATLCAVLAVTELAKTVFRSAALLAAADRLADCLENGDGRERARLVQDLTEALVMIRERAPGALVTFLLELFDPDDGRS